MRLTFDVRDIKVEQPTTAGRYLVWDSKGDARCCFYSVERQRFTDGLTVQTCRWWAGPIPDAVAMRDALEEVGE